MASRFHQMPAVRLDMWQLSQEFRGVAAFPTDLQGSTTIADLRLQAIHAIFGRLTRGKAERVSSDPHRHAAAQARFVVFGSGMVASGCPVPFIRPVRMSGYPSAQCGLRKGHRLQGQSTLHEWGLRRAANRQSGRRRA